jgi:hypothetical protein
MERQNLDHSHALPGEPGRRLSLESRRKQLPHDLRLGPSALDRLSLCLKMAVAETERVRRFAQTAEGV